MNQLLKRLDVIGIIKDNQKVHGRRERVYNEGAKPLSRFQ